MRKSLRPILIFIVTGLLYAWANRIAAAHFRISPDLALVYPPTGVGVAAVFLFGAPAAAAVGVATLLTPWTDKPVADAAYSLVNILEAAVPFVAFHVLARRTRFRRRDRELRTPRARLTFFLTGVAVNTALCAVLGNLVSRTLGRAASPAPFIRDVAYWWIGDAAAALLLGWPLLELTYAGSRQLRALRARHHHAALAASSRTPSRVSVAGRNVVAGLLFTWALVAAAVLVGGISIPEATLSGVPIMLAAYLYGFRGGLIVGSLLGWLQIGRAVVTTGFNPIAVVAASLDVFDRVGLGILTGTLFEANRRLIRQMGTQYASLRQDLTYVAGVLTAAVESKDPYTEGHMQRVSVYSVRIARRLGLSEEETEKVRLAALLHDIGKIGVPDRILFKREPLEDDEIALMRSHAEIGARIAERCSILKDAAPVIRSHQERWDGQTDGPFCGYPDGLKGEQIPLHARIAAVADAYDTMTTNRPYRKAMGREKAIETLLQERGRQFDPEIVDAFVADLAGRRHKKASGLFSLASLVGKKATEEEDPAAYLR